MKKEFDRRKFLQSLFAATMSGVAASCTKQLEKIEPLLHVPPGQSLARFPEKTELILLTDRPPQLETPLFYFREDLTPNEAFFVRWHLAGIPTEVDLNTFRLNLGGHVDKPLSLSVDELKKNFEPARVVAVVQCSGNSRRYFNPPVPGGQWQNGALGNAAWTGVRLKDLLAAAGVKKGAVQISVSGLDEAPLSNMPKFVKALDIEHALSDDVLVAYEMNDAPLPMLNGFPLRLVVPGYFATYWVKSLNEINVLPSKFAGFWMDKSYRIPKNPFAEEEPHNLAKDTIPINKLNLRSLFVRPDPSDIVKAGQDFQVEGIAFDDGSGIKKIEVAIMTAESAAMQSLDSSQSTRGEWKPATLQENKLGKYSWSRWRLSWRPEKAGDYVIKVRASNANETQTETQHWNKSGYMRNVIESVTVRVV